jgi:hypothetical protein
LARGAMGYSLNATGEKPNGITAGQGLKQAEAGF